VNCSTTVPFHSIQQLHITGPPKWVKCHSHHGQFPQVPKSSGKHVLYIYKIPCLQCLTDKNLLLHAMVPQWWWPYM